MCLCDYLLCEKSIVFGSMVHIVRYNVSTRHFVNNLSIHNYRLTRRSL